MEAIKKVNVPMCILLLVSIRMMFTDASFALSIFGIGIAGLYAYDMWMAKKYTKSLDQSTREELDSIKSMVSGMAVKQGVKPEAKASQKYF